jgi:hypothetical protein
MNTWQQKIGFCAHTCPPDCACPIRKDPCWLKSASDSGAGLWPKSPPWPRPDTILAWYRKLIAHKFDGSKYRRYPGRPRIEPKLEALIVQMTKENSGWGYDRILGALANLGYKISDQTVGNVLKRHGIAPAPKRSQTMTWKEFIQSHRHRFLHGRSAHLAWVGDILHLVLDPLGESACQLGRNHPASRPGMDAADGAQRNRPHVGISGAAAVRIARSRHQVLLGVSDDARVV